MPRLVAGLASASGARAGSPVSIPTCPTRLPGPRDQLPLPTSGACDQLADQGPPIASCDDARPASHQPAV